MFKIRNILLMASVMIFVLSGCNRKENFISKVSEELQLNTEQEQMLRTSVEGLADEYEETRELRRDFFDEIEKSLQEATFPKEKVKESVRAKIDRAENFIISVIDKFDEFNAILTADQKKKLQESFGKIKDKRYNWKKGKHHRRGGKHGYGDKDHDEDHDHDEDCYKNDDN